MKNCSFTGHRIIEKSVELKLEALLYRAIEYVYSEGCRNFYAGGALGFDTMAAKAIIKMKLKYNDMRLIIVVPCREQADLWGEADRDMYEYILSSADEVIFTSDVYTKNCMKQRNEKLVELSDVVIAYSGRKISGSAQTVRIAKEEGKTVYNLFSRVNELMDQT